MIIYPMEHNYYTSHRIRFQSKVSVDSVRFGLIWYHHRIRHCEAPETPPRQSNIPVYQLRLNNRFLP
jgi:hypothetical protein